MLNTQALEQGAVADYLDHFGLTEDPFLDQGGELFDGANRRDQFEQLIHLSQFSTSVLAVVGERGMGKSVFKRELLARIDESEIVVDMSAPVLNDPRQLLIDIAQAFNLPSVSSIPDGEPGQIIDHLVELIGHYGAAAEDDDPLKILIIDEAHQLDEQSLSALMRIAQYQDEDHRCLHLILFGENMFGVRLVQCAKSDQMVQVFHLETLSREDLRAYLRFRLDLAGFSGIFPFSDDDISFLHDVSQGIPSAVHEPAREILIEMVLPEPEARRLGLPLPHMAIIVVLAAGLLLILLLSSSGDDEPAVIPLAVDHNSGNKTLSQLGERTAGDAADTRDQEESASVEDPDEALVEPLELVAEKAEVESERTVIAKPVLPVVSGGANSVAVAPKEDPSKPMERVLAEEEGLVAESAAALPDSSSQPTAEAMPDLKDEPPAQPFGIEAAMLADAEAELFTIDERRLLDTPADKYTLQVLSGTVREAVDDYIVRQPNRSQLRVYSAKRNDRVVYIVVAGVFSSLDLARQAINQLPDVQRKAGAWPRQMGSIHKDINGFKRNI
ncbi:hypothetical protein NBRC116494_04260 [Aurantivibrio plasticivorans]